jgi:hypothetical protein
LVAAEKISIEKAKSVRLRTLVLNRLSTIPGSSDLALRIAIDEEGSKFERKDGPIKGTSSVATIRAAMLTDAPRSDPINALWKIILTAFQWIAAQV